MEDLTGKQFGPYRVVAPLGEGGMAAVYRAYQASVDRFVALKVLPRYFATDPEFVGRFEQEAKLLAKLQHLHILAVHDFGEADGYTYIVMPFVESGTLADLLQGEPLPLHRIQQIITQVAGALDHAHAKGIIHRDIKPSNVLVDQDGNCLLTDFGIAKMVGESTAFTQTGGIIGTPTYMSPEQIRGEELDGRSDIYSLGVVLYEMATGRAPYRAETPPAVFVKHLHDPLPPPHIYCPDIPQGVERVILKALSKDRQDRFLKAGEMAIALAQGIAGEPASAPTVKPSSAPTALPPGELPPAPRRLDRTEVVPSPKREKRPFPLWAIGLIGLLALAIIVVTAINLLGPRDDAGDAGQGATPVADAATELPAAASTSAPDPTETPVPPTVTPPPTPTRMAAVEEPLPTPVPDPWGEVIVPAGEPILIAFVGDLSGSYSEVGRRQVEAFVMAIQDTESVMGFPIEPLVRDGACSPDQAAEIANAISSTPNLVGLVGHTCSVSCASGIPIYEESHLVSISGSCTMMDLTEDDWDLFNRVAVREDRITDEFILQMIEAPPFIEFVADFEKRAGMPLVSEELGDLSPLVAYTYDATRILLEGIGRAAREDDQGNLIIGRQLLAETVRATPKYLGVTGIISFDERGDRLLSSTATDPWGQVIVPPGQPVRIAFVGALSGPVAFFGEAQQTAFLIALEDAEEIIGFPVEPHFVDTACSPERALLVAGDLVNDVNDAGIVGVVGHTCSETCAEAIPIYEDAHLVSVSPSCGRPDLTEGDWQLFNRVAPPDGESATDFAIQVESTDSFQDFALTFEQYHGILPIEVGEPPTGAYIAYAYDAARVLLHAIRDAAVIDDAGNLIIGRQALAETVRATHRLLGVTGPITFDERGDRLPPGAAEECRLRVGLVASMGGIVDAGFNQGAWQGLQRAGADLNVCVDFLESHEPADYEENIALFVQQGMDLIITVGFEQIEATALMAERNPDLNFAIVDVVFDPPIPNVHNIIFDVDQAAFLAGYLAAAWADLQDPDDPQVGYVAGMEIPPVMQFIVGYTAGLDYYNEQKGADVLLQDGVADTFTEPGVGLEMGNMLIDQGVDVLFVVAGPTGNGALAAARERGKWGIGVDMDQYVTLPDERGILLTSVLKRIDNAVYALVEAAVRGAFNGGETTVGILANDGVGLAPFHDFESLIPSSIKEELAIIRQNIIDGVIDTGW